MKRSILVVFLLLCLTSCNSNGYGTNDKKCIEGTCLSFEIAKPLEALSPTLITITIDPNRDAERMDFNITLFQNVTLTDIYHEDSNFHLDNSIINGYGGWYENIKAGEKYIITAKIILAMPDPNQSKSVYDLLIGIKLSPGATVLMINPLFYLDIEGKALTKSEAENIKNITNDIITAVPSGIIVEGTFHPFPSTSTPRPENTQALILDVSTGTPTPTVTPTATITATFPAYPGP